MSESKAKKQKSPKAPAATPVIVVSSSSRFGWLPKIPRKTLLAALLVIAVIAVGTGGLLGYQAYQRSQQIAPNTDTDYSTTDVKNIPKLLKHQYGINPSKVDNATLDKKLTTFKAASDVALALNRLNKTALANHAYDIAFDKAASSDRVGVDFYAEMYGLAYKQHNKQLGDRAYNAAVKLVQQSGASDDDKRGTLLSLSDGREQLLEEYKL